MQNIVNQYIRNGLNYSALQSVTYFHVGNYSANGLVT